MNVNISKHHTSENCTWCEKTKECVTADFDDAFIGKAAMCWSCLQKAIKVQSRKEFQASVGSSTKPSNK